MSFVIDDQPSNLVNSELLSSSSSTLSLSANSGDATVASHSSNTDTSSPSHSKAECDQAATTSRPTDECDPQTSGLKDYRKEAFEDLGISKEVVDAIALLKVTEPNELQRAIVPVLLNNKTQSIFIKSRPHSGKKIGYLIPLIERVDASASRVQCVILQPSLELDVFVAGVASDVAKNKNVIVDYAAENESIQNLRGHIIVSTLDNFLHFLRSREKEVHPIDCLVFDEFDLLLRLDKSAKKIFEIMDILKDKIGQMQFYSNCFGNDSKRFIERSLTKDLLMIEKLKRACLSNHLHFYAHFRNRHDRYMGLLKILDHTVFGKVIIFTHDVRSAVFVFDSLKQNGFKHKAMLLSDKSTIEEKLITINNFNTNSIGILVIAYPTAQGIPLIDLSMVINYTVPNSPKHLRRDYFQRISRCTNTDTKPNFVVNLVEDDTKTSIPKLEKLLGINIFRLEVGSLAREPKTN